MEKEHGETLASRTRARLVCYQYQTSPQHAALSAIYETLKTIRSRSLIA
ncbi:hypothetical protein BDA96_01G220400 [Sorghum bicolor]|uniref:Uncharacterized protein n=1 Tax=Sorghum bicolor TaxID=4558 RepID=A0A921UZE0_SORBI|nr:hypothetical protein BDA96_01G220400 [Sorghum bicolor]